MVTFTCSGYEQAFLYQNNLFLIRETESMRNGSVFDGQFSSFFSPKPCKKNSLRNYDTSLVKQKTVEVESADY